MKPQITEKINSKIIQFAWDTQVLYLKIKENENGKKSYIIRDVPEETSVSCTEIASMTQHNTFSIPIPVGQITLSFSSNNSEEVIKYNKCIIERNIEFLRNVQEIFDYIENVENGNSK